MPVPVSEKKCLCDSHLALRIGLAGSCGTARGCHMYARAAICGSIWRMPVMPQDPPTAAQPALFTSWLEALPEPHIVFDRDYRIVAANSAYRRQFGQGTQVVGRTCHAVSHHSPVPCDQAGETCPLARALHSGQRERVLHLHHTPTGEDYVQIELVPLRGESGQPMFFMEKMERTVLCRDFLIWQSFLMSAADCLRLLHVWIRLIHI